MILCPFDKLPKDFQNNDVKIFYNKLKHKKTNLILKKTFDIILSFSLIILFLPLFLIISIVVKLTSKGRIFYLQERVTTCKKTFKIIKFRTMIENADKMGSLLTVNNDARITKVGEFLRKTRLDEIPQLFNILKGEMSFVGARPEVPKYVDKYSDQMKSTLLMPAGVTSLASINFKNEDKLLNNAENVDKTYINKILPEKMKYNLEYIEKFNLIYDFKIMFKTIFAVAKNNE